MLLLEAVTQIVDVWRIALFAVLANRITATINDALKAFGFLTRRHDRPIRPGANRGAPLKAIELAAIVQDECSRTGCCHADAEASYRFVVGNGVAAYGGGQAAYY